MWCDKYVWHICTELFLNVKIHPYSLLGIFVDYFGHDVHKTRVLFQKFGPDEIWLLMLRFETEMHFYDMSYIVCG